MKSTVRDKNIVEGGVKGVYQTVNPSITEIENPATYQRLENKYKMLMQEKLKLPLKLFRGATMLDFGSGTGERMVFFRKWGCDTTSVEFNELAIQRAQTLMKTFGVEDKGRYHHSGVFEFNTDERFDFVTAFGVIHHTHSTELAFKRLVTFMKPDGFVVAGSANVGGYFQRSLQRHIVLYAKQKFDRPIPDVAWALFPDHIRRAAQAALRSEETVIYDTYINPRYNGCSLLDFYRWVRESGLTVYSSWPDALPFGRNDSTWEEPVVLEDEALAPMAAIQELLWMALKDHDIEGFRRLSDLARPFAPAFFQMGEAVNDVHAVLDTDTLGRAHEGAEKIREALPNLQRHLGETYFRNVSGFLTECSELLNFLRKDGFTFEELAARIHSTKNLFRGVAGSPQTYIVATRPLYPRA